MRRGKEKISLLEKFLHFEKPKKYFVEFITRRVVVKLHLSQTCIVTCFVCK